MSILPPSVNFTSFCQFYLLLAPRVLNLLRPKPPRSWTHALIKRFLSRGERGRGISEPLGKTTECFEEQWMRMGSFACLVPSHSPTDNTLVRGQTYQCSISTEWSCSSLNSSFLIPVPVQTAFWLRSQTLPHRRSITVGRNRNGKNIIHQLNPSAGSVPAQSEKIKDTYQHVQEHYPQRVPVFWPAKHCHHIPRQIQAGTVCAPPRE